MKTIKRIAALALCLALVCSLLPGLSLRANAETYSGICGAEGDGSNLTWTLDTETGVLTIEGSGAMKDYDSGRDIPWYAYRTSVTSLRIAQGVTGIGAWAFCGCENLGEAAFPDGVTSIGRNAFSGCVTLSSVTIPNSVKSIDNAAFSSTALTSVTIPYGVKEIADSTFFNCIYLESITLPSTVTSLGQGVFWECRSLKNVTLPEGLTRIGAECFQLCSALTSIVIPADMESIGDYAFDRCSSLNSVIFRDGVKQVGNAAFTNCIKLSYIVLPASVESIGEYAFGYKDGWDGMSKVKDFFVCGYKDTAAQAYAEENGFLFCRPDLFTDVNINDYFFIPVIWAVSHEPQITAGIGNSQFGSNNNCTREQIVTFLWAANGKPEPEGTGATFSDVSADAWYYKPVAWAVENGITSGMGDGSFGVGQSCTRAQAMTFLWAAKGKPAPETAASPFSDVSEGDWYYDAVLWAYENEVTAGMGDGSFGANSTCTRAQIITFLYKAYVILHERE